MPDSGADVLAPMTRSHTATPQWQSFELRMRQRRAERCLVRADLAWSAGLFEEARIATEEARDLAPDLPEVAAMDRRLAGSGEVPDLILHQFAPADVLQQFAPAEVLHGEHDEVLERAGADDAEDYTEAVHREKKGGGRVFIAATLAALAVALTTGALLTWQEWTRGAAAPTAVDASLRGDVTLRTEASTEPAPDPVVSGPVTPDPADSVPTSTSGRTDALPETMVRDAGKAALIPTVSAPAPVALPARTATPSAATANLASASAANTPNVAVRDARPALSTVVGLPPAPAAAPREEMPRAPVIEAVPLAAAALPAAGAVPSGPPAPPPVSTARAAESTAAIDAQAAVRATLARYEAAFSGLNVPAARAVWPAVDERALTRAFDGLAAQRIALDRCDVTVAGSTARALCSGSAQWTPKVGGGQRTQSRRWAFDLSSAAGRWQIVRAETR